MEPAKQPAPQYLNLNRSWEGKYTADGPYVSRELADQHAINTRVKTICLQDIPSPDLKAQASYWKRVALNLACWHAATAERAARVKATGPGARNRFMGICRHAAALLKQEPGFTAANFAATAFDNDAEVIDRLEKVFRKLSKQVNAKRVS